MKKRVLSGMRPTGKLHLGHLLGALANWEKLQQQYECLFMVADWHALMSEYENPERIAEYSIDNAIDWIACGVDPDKSAIFIQSKVDEHLELAMILGDLTPLSHERIEHVCIPSPCHLARGVCSCRDLLDLPNPCRRET